MTESSSTCVWETVEALRRYVYRTADDRRAIDALMRRLSDEGYLDTDLILNAGIRKSCALEVGPGPGYLGLESLHRTTGTCPEGA